MRKTKVICTIGPASDDEKILTKMMQAGMNVARCNFSHGDHAQHQKRIDMIKHVREKLNLPVAIMLDTKGPEYRIGVFENNEIELKEEDSFVFTTEDIIGNKDIVSVSYKGLPQELEIHDRILVNNGLVIFEVEKIEDNKIYTKVINGGKLSNRKSMSFPNKHLKQEFLSEADKEDLLFGIEKSPCLLLLLNVREARFSDIVLFSYLPSSENPFAHKVHRLVFSSLYSFVFNTLANSPAAFCDFLCSQ